MKTIMLLTLLVAAVGCASQKQMTLRFHEQVNARLPDQYARTVEIPSVRLKIPVSVSAALSERDVVGADLMETAGGLAVVLRFNTHGAVALDEVTTRSRGQYLVVFVNDRPVTAWLVDRRLSKGEFILEGDLSDEEARELVTSLNGLAKKRNSLWG